MGIEPMYRALQSQVVAHIKPRQRPFSEIRRRRIGVGEARLGAHRRTAAESMGKAVPLGSRVAGTNRTSDLTLAG